MLSSFRIRVFHSSVINNQSYTQNNGKFGFINLRPMIFKKFVPSAQGSPTSMAEILYINMLNVAHQKKKVGKRKKKNKRKECQYS